jgi:sulfur-oxidizing protein SoxY
MRVNRRAFLASAAAVATTVTIVPFAARATPEALTAAIKEVTGDAPLREGKVTLDVPPLVENGNTVPLTVSVASPMTADDHVKTIHVFNEKNPQPHVFNAWLSPANGRAVIATRIKLADAQKVVAIAETSKGEFWTAHAEVIVTIAACIEDIT